MRGLPGSLGSAVQRRIVDRHEVTVQKAQWKAREEDTESVACGGWRVQPSPTSSFLLQESQRSGRRDCTQ